MERPGAAQLTTYFRLNALCCLIAIGWLVAIRIWVVPTAWIDVLIALLLGLCLSLVGADLLLRWHRFVAAIVTVSLSTWLVAICVAGMVPFALLVLPLVIVLPVLLAVPYLSRAHLAAMFGATLLATATMVIVGRLTGGVGLEARAPDWLLDALTVTFIPITTGLALFLAWRSQLTLSTQTAALWGSRIRLIYAADQERRRIERSLHEGTRQRLAAAREQLRALALATPERAGALLDRLIEQLQEGSRELRDLAHGIYPPELAEHGLVAALRTAAQRAPLPVSVHSNGIGRYPPEIENGAYFCCVEALREAVNHGDATTRVVISLAGGDGLFFDIRATGLAGAPADDRLTAMSDRLGAVGGVVGLRVHSGRMDVSGHVPLPGLAAGTPTGWRRSRSRIRHGLGLMWTVVGGLLGRIPPAIAQEEAAAVGIGGGIIPAAASTLFVLCVYAIFRDAWILLVAAINAADIVVLIWARRRIRSGHVREALLTTTAAIWALAFAATTLAPVVLHESPLLMILPVLIAIPYVRPRMFMWIIGMTIVAAAAIALVGRFATGVGIQERAPEWIIDFNVISFVVGNVVVALFVTSLNHAALAGKVEAVRDSRARLVVATDRERQRIERDLHDGAQQRLAAAAVEARVAHRLVEQACAHQARPLLDQLAMELDETDAELRDLAGGIYPSELIRHGLVTALRAAAGRSPLPTTVHTTGIGRYRPEIETNVYFCCLEALHNAIRHAGTHATVTITLEQSRGLVFDVGDTGTGCEPSVIESGHGYANISARVGAIGGTLTVLAKPGAGVRLRGHVPGPGGGGCPESVLQDVQRLEGVLQDNTPQRGTSQHALGWR